MVILLIIAAYLVLGLIFSIVFLAKGIHKIDDSAQTTSLGFKLILIPGITVFWPVLLKKWRKAK